MVCMTGLIDRLYCLMIRPTGVCVCVACRLVPGHI
ncbi:hypothetical protein LSH36_203g03016 [Paralvinella palmiformis]|uniref:Uncharacterized protein n=1 Tax=Paralvinella palmiformis TaxID=53620 RepID=A0AAD9JQ41_9ANNE|nr:hypothetical protein LSH36_203g03016 [Paralvinella palmiformis]